MVGLEGGSCARSCAWLAMCAALLACGGARAGGSSMLDADSEDGLDAAQDPEPDVSGGDTPMQEGMGGADPLLDAAMQTEADAGPAAVPDASAPPQPRVSFRAPTGATWEGTGSWSIEVVLSAPAPAAQSLRLLLGGTAMSGPDYMLADTLKIAAGQTSARISVQIIDDATPEPSETLSLSLAGVEPAQSYVLRIADDDDQRWPDAGAVTTLDAARKYPGGNLSGLAFQPARAGMGAALWMVRNSPSQLYRLEQSGGQFVPSSGNGFGQGKTLTFPNGAGAPDAEDISWGEWSSPRVYVVSERDGDGTSAPAILVYDSSAAGTTLVAQRAWDLSKDLAALNLDANLGPEALTWVPDTYLVGAGFRDDARNAAYDPARYPNHGAGLFFVGIEQTGGIYAYALNHDDGTLVRVAQIDSGMPGVMALEFDRDVNYLWAWCDDACGNRAALLRVEDNPASPRAGRFGVRRRLAHPASLPDLNHEGMSLGTATDCSEGKKSVYWVEDGTGDHVLRKGSIPCGAFLEP